MLKLHHWLVCLLLMNVPVYGMLISDKIDFSEYAFYKNIVDERIQQGLKGDDLIQFKNGFNLLVRLVLRDDFERNPQCCSYYPALLQRLIDYDPLLKKSKEFHGALYTSAWKKNLRLTKWFIVNGANVDFDRGGALRGAANRNIQSIVILLLMHNANPNLQDFFGVACVHDIIVNQVRYYSNNYPCAFATEQDQCDMAHLLMVGGADISLRTNNHCGLEFGYNEKTAVEIACREQKFKLASVIERTALQRDSLFAVVAKGKVIPFRSTNDKERESWTSRYHARTIHGDSLLHCAFAYNNLPVAQKLVYLWPQLLAQPNFKGETVFDLFPQKCIELLQFNSVL